MPNALTVGGNTGGGANGARGGTPLRRQTQAGSVRPHRGGSSRDGSRPRVQGSGIGGDIGIFSTSTADILTANEVSAMQKQVEGISGPTTNAAAAAGTTGASSSRETTNRYQNAANSLDLTTGGAANDADGDGASVNSNSGSSVATSATTDNKEKDRDHRVLLMQKQALTQSIEGSVDEFVRHMRDITLDRMHLQGRGRDVHAGGALRGERDRDVGAVGSEYDE